jgi:outer membrane lipopolysaccharide assembly protein LptE/RlpB
MDRRYASRKFLLAVAAFLAACGFLLAGKIDAAQWIAFVEWIVGLYMAGNVGDTVAEGVRNAIPAR